MDPSAFPGTLRGLAGWQGWQVFFVLFSVCFVYFLWTSCLVLFFGRAGRRVHGQARLGTGRLSSTCPPPGPRASPWGWGRVRPYYMFTVSCIRRLVYIVFRVSCMVYTILYHMSCVISGARDGAPPDLRRQARTGCGRGLRLRAACGRGAAAERKSWMSRVKHTMLRRSQNVTT